MQYKYLSFIIIIVIALYVAYSIKKYGDRKLEFHYAIVDLITYIRNQISCFCTPTRELIAGYDNELLKKAGFLEKIDGNDWEYAVKSCTFLDDKGKNILLAFSSKLGKTTAEQQTENCDYALNSLNVLLEEYKADIPKKYKAYSSLAVIMGLMMLILLI